MKYLVIVVGVAMLASVPIGTVQAQCVGGECAIEASGGPLVKVAVAGRAVVRVAVRLPVKVAARVAERVRARPFIRRVRARVHARPLLRGLRGRVFGGRRCCG